MSPRRLALVAGCDLKYSARRFLFWVWAALLALLAWGLSEGTVRIQSGDSQVGGTKSHITSEFAVAQLLAVLTPLIYGFFVAVVGGMAVISDDEARVGEVLHATPLRPGEYIWGKFLAVILATLAVLAIHLGVMIVCNHVLPAGAARDYRGTFRLLSYLRPALLFTVPTVVFVAGVSFFIGERGRKPILVYFFPVAVLLGCAFFLWRWSPSWLDPRVDKFLMLLDPAGFRWLSETWLKGDRGVAFYNTASVPIDGVFAANRLLTLAIGLGAVAWSQHHFATTLRGVRARAPKKGAAPVEADDLAVNVAPEAVSVGPPERSLGSLGMTAARPGFFAGAGAVARAELAELLASPGLYLFVPLLVLEAFGPSLIAVGAFDTPLLLTPGTMAERTFGPLTTMTCLLLLFYTVESLGRERHTRLASFSMATPVRTGSLLFGKALANASVGVIVILAQWLVSALAIAWQWRVGQDVRPFVLLWGVLLVPTLFLWTGFVMAVYSATRNRYATYAIALAVIFYTGYREIVGEINWVGNWPLWGVTKWSDISVLEVDRLALGLNRLMAVGLAVLFVTLTVKFYPRREFDPIRLMQRLRPWPLFKTVLWLLPVAVVPVAAASVLWATVDRGFQGDASKKLQKDYWRKNLSTYLDWPLPDVSALDVAVDLDPARSHLKVAGAYELVNNRDKPIRQIPVTGGLHWESPKWTLDGNEAKPDLRAGLFVFTPTTPIPPGGTFKLGFAFEGVFPKGVTRNGGGTNEFIVPSGVVLTSFGTSFLPALGFNEGVGVDDENKHDSKEYPDDYYEGQTDSFVGNRAPFKTKVAITGPADFTLNSVGTVTKDGVKDGRRTTVWESDQPVNFLNVVAGRWAVRRGEGTAIYYHPAHGYNVGEMVEALDAARKYYSEWFRPYRWKELKLSEFPALADYAQGFPTDITFSESIGFLTKSDPRANAAFMVTAHEAAHQWWGNMIAPGKGPGGNLLSEGTAHFSTLLLFEQVKGLRDRIEFAKRIEDRYAKNRRADSERPLVKIDGSRDGDQTVTYDKAGMVFWMLSNHMGREKALEGIREFFERYHANVDHPVIQDFLAVLRKHAPDADAFDAFTHQWFYSVVVPEYRLTKPTKVKAGAGWTVSATLENTGTGVMPVEVAAVRGARFLDDGKPDPKYREARATVSPAAGASKGVEIQCDFRPEKIVIDPDVKVLQLRRKSAFADVP